MNRITKFLLVCLLTLSATFLRAQGDEGRMLVKTLDPGFSTLIQLDWNYPTKGEAWDQNTLRVLLDVKLDNGSEAVLKQLMQAGRYAVEGTKGEGDKYVISIPGLKKEVTYKGVKMNETVTAMVYVPSSTEVNTADGKSVEIQSLIAKKFQAAGLAMKGEQLIKPFDCEIHFTCSGSNAEPFDANELKVDGVTVQVK